MKTFVYQVSKRDQRFIDESKYLDELEIETRPYAFEIDRAEELKGFEAVLVQAVGDFGKEALDVMASYGIKILVTRSVGYDKIDVDYAREVGIQVANVANYSPNAISEFTLGLALASVRNFKSYIINASNFDFSTPKKAPKEIRFMTVGIIGGGHIGSLVAKGLHALGAKVLVYSIDEDPSLKDIVTYCSLDELYEKSELISLHVPLLDSTYHLLDKEAFDKMQDGVVIINTARGPLINAEDLLEALKSKKVESAGLDVYEYEAGIFRGEVGSGKDDEVFRQLIEHPRVIMTPHDAYYTEEAIRNMVLIGLENVLQFSKTGKAKYPVN